MKRLHTLPTDKVILECLANDTLNRNEDVARFCLILDSLHECTSIALDGAWGSGKTFFVKEVKMLLDGFCNKKSLSDETREGFDRVLSSDGNKYTKISLSQKHFTVYYDAWANDNDADPILSIIRAIVGSKQVSMPISNQRNTIKILSSVADCLTGSNFSDLSDAIVGEDPLECITKFDYIHTLMGRMINSAIGDSDIRLVIFIDELDRCKPSFAVSLLERIKHYFTDDRLTFLFSVNQDQLQHTIKSYYGNGMNGSKYLEKLFDISVPLPEANLQGYINSLGFNSKTFFYDKVYLTVIKYFKLGLRETSKMLEYLKLTTYDIAHDRRRPIKMNFDNARNFGLIYIAPILVGLRLHDITAYKSFIEGNLEDKFIDILLLPEIGITRVPYLIGSNEILTRERNPNSITDVNGKVEVNITERLSSVYSSIFKDDFDDNIEVNIGSITIDKQLKPCLLKMANPISEYACIEQ